MGRKRTQGFTSMKMLSSRVEESDYDKFEDCLTRDNLSVQGALNLFIRSYISGNVAFSGSSLVGTPSNVNFNVVK